MKSFRSLSRIRYGLLTLPLCGFLALSGCASGPSGGATVPNNVNRLVTTLTLQGNLNPNYYYAVAFDDSPGADTGTAFDGPTAIVGNTPILNGVVGGNWRVAVIWHNNNQFQVFRRGVTTDVSTEKQISSGALITRRASGNTIEFTLNLDYVEQGERLFPLNNNGTAPQVFDVNFVTTNEIIKNSAETTIKPVDSYGTSATSTPITNIQLSGSNTRQFTDETGDDDLNLGANRPVNFNFAQIDVARLNLAAIRTDAP